MPLMHAFVMLLFAGPAAATATQSTSEPTTASTTAPTPTPTTASTTAPTTAPTTTPTVGAPAPAVRCSVAVLDLEAQGLAADEVHVPRVLSEAVATAVAEASGCDVITRQDIASMIGFEAERQACGSETSDSCLAEIGSALGVERIVAGAVSRLGGATTVTVRLMSLKTGHVDRRAERTVEDAARLREAARAVGQELFGGVSSPSSSGLWWAGIVTLGAGATVAVGGGLLVAGAESTLGNAGETAKRKEGAVALGTGGLVVVGAGLVAGLVGGALTIAGAVE